MLTYLKETHRIHGTTYEAILCPAHFADLPDFMKTPHGYNPSGYKVEVRPWTDREGHHPMECSLCNVAPELRGMAEKSVGL